MVMVSPNSLAQYEGPVTVLDLFIAGSFPLEAMIQIEKTRGFAVRLHALNYVLGHSSAV